MGFEPEQTEEPAVLAAEHQVELRSSGLKKELRVVDLVGIQIIGTLGFTWIGTAGKLGSAHVMFWIGAVLLFYVPSGIVVAHLATEMPLEGGLYQWVKLRFGPAYGFIAALNLWAFGVLIIGSIGLLLLGMVPYIVSAEHSGFAANKPLIVIATAVGVGSAMFVAWRGLSFGKWISTVGGFLMASVIGAAILAAAPHWLAGDSVTPPIAFTFPALTLLNLNILGKMGFAALSGIDGVAVFAGECRSDDVGRAIRKSIWLAAPVIAALMVLGTASVLTFSRPEAIDLLMPPLQVLGLGAPRLAVIAAVAASLAWMAQASYALGMLSRLPMVAGWDHLLPEWFSRLHPRYRTPTGSVMFLGAATMVASVGANAGTGNQEAFQFLNNGAMVCFAVSYIFMFAIPLIAPGERPSWTVRIAALSGLGMTVLFVVLSVFPLVEEQNPGWFAIRMIGVVGGMQAAGLLFYWRASRNPLAHAA